MHRLFVCSSLFLVPVALAASCRDQSAPASSSLSVTKAEPGKPKIDIGELPPPPTGEIKGKLELDSSLASKVAAGDIIYIIARNPATGSAVAVTRTVAPAKFPADFVLSGGHAMSPGQGGLFGKVRLTARVDKDGDPTSKNPGDVVGELTELVEVPAQGVVLKLDKQL